MVARRVSASACVKGGAMDLRRLEVVAIAVLYVQLFYLKGFVGTVV